MKLYVNAPHFHPNPFWPKQIWLWGWAVNTQVLLCWDKATLCIHVQSWVHMCCGRGGAAAALLSQTYLCSVLCTLKPKIRLNSPWALHLPAWKGCDHWFVVGWSELPFLFGVITANYVKKCVHRTPSHEPHASLVTPWATICSSNLQLAIFFSLVWAKELIANSF